MPLPLIYIFHPYIRYIYNYYIVHISAWSISIASPPRTSPTIILSGRIRNADLIRSLIVTDTAPSILAIFASSRTRLSIPLMRSSALSSIVISLSSAGIYSDIAARNVVFPLPVPPPMIMEYLAFTSFCKNCAHSCVMLPSAISFSIVMGCSGKRRIVRIGPFNATG